MSDRRFTDKFTSSPQDVRDLPQTHPAMMENRTLFPSTVITVTGDVPDRLLVSGANNRKLGNKVEKGAFKGYALFGLSLEERATCPASCPVRAACYGNGMQMARRHRIGDPDVFFDRLGLEIADLIREHGGILVRLHVLGDFPSVDYVAFWKDALDENEKLAVYGYTSRLPSRDGGCEIGDAIEALKDAYPDRFRIRWSSAKPRPDGASVVTSLPSPRPANVIPCPVQTEATACCATCALCWEASARDKTILFLKHGPKSSDNAASVINRSDELDEDARYALEDRVRQLEGVLKDDGWIPAEWSLTPSETTVLNVLLKRSIASKDAIHTVLYGDDPDGGPDLKIVDVFICKLRDKLGPFGIEIISKRGDGYRLSPGSFHALDAMSRGMPPPLPGELVGSALARMDVRPIVPIMLPGGQKPAALQIDRPTVKMVRIADMKIERAYQRDMTAKSITLIRKIITGWDWTKFKPPIGVEGEDGAVIIIDGQHTAIAAASHPGLAALPVLIVDASTIEQRAQSFVSHNRDRIAMSPLQLFHAEVAAGDVKAIAVLRAAMETGVTIPRSPPKKSEDRRGVLVGIAAARRIASVRPAAIRRIFEIAAAARVSPIATTAIYALDILIGTPAFADISSMPNSAISAALASIADFEASAQVAAAQTGQNRYRAGALLVAQLVRKPIG